MCPIILNCLQEWQTHEVILECINKRHKWTVSRGEDFSCHIKIKSMKTQKTKWIIVQQRAINRASHGSASILTIIEYWKDFCILSRRVQSTELLYREHICSLILYELCSMIVLCCSIISIVTCVMFDNKHLYIIIVFFFPFLNTGATSMPPTSSWLSSIYIMG